MKIVHHFRTRGEGAEGVHIAGIADAFEALGHRVEFVSPGGLDPRIRHAHRSGAAPASDSRPLPRSGWKARLADALPAQVFELLEIAYNLVALPNLWRATRGAGLLYERHAFFLAAGALVARWRDIPYAVEVNELVGDERVRAQPLLSALARWTDRFVFQRASAVIVVSPHLARRAAASGAHPARTHVLPNAVDSAFAAAKPDPAKARSAFGLDACDAVIGYVGGLVAWHRLDRLFDVCATLLPEFPHLRILIAGRGPLEEALKAHAKQLGLRVVFSGSIPHARIPEVLSACDVAVVPHSNAYRSPIKLFEAMAMGRCTVAPDTEPVRMVAEDGIHALLFDPESAASLRAALARGLAEPSLRETMGAAARERVLSRHTWEHNARATLAALQLPL